MAEQGHSVVLLEKGGYHPRQDFTQREDQMIPMLFKNCGLQFTIPGGIAVAQGSCVEGRPSSTTPSASGRPTRCSGGGRTSTRSADIGPAAMKKHFEKIEPRISVSEVQPYELNRNSLILKEGCEKLGWAAAPNKRNCKDCRQCGLCHLGCYYGTKQSMLETYIADIQAVHGDLVKIYADADGELDQQVRAAGRPASAPQSTRGGPPVRPQREGGPVVVVSCRHHRLVGAAPEERPRRQREGRQERGHPSFTRR